MSLFLGLLFLFLLSFVTTGLMRRYALRHDLLDVPNHRSSHHLPTPRGGGMAIVATFLVGLPLLHWLFGPDVTSSLALIWLATALIAVLGFVDDHVSLSPKFRLLCQFLVAFIVIWAMRDAPVLQIGSWRINLAWFGYIVSMLGVVWLINLYNFMDGIDGLAAIEAVSVCIVLALVHWLGGGDSLISLSVLVLLVGVGGFLCWNFPPARIFMGDGGSGFLGLALAAMMLFDAQHEPRILWIWLVMLGVFVVDGTWTLLTRWRLGCKLSEAHRTHAYQYASRRYNSHKVITWTVLAINMLWLFPISLLVFFGVVDGVIALFMAYLPLCTLAYYFRAGIPE